MRNNSTPTWLNQCRLLLLLLFGLPFASFGQYCTPTYNTDCGSGDFINDVSFVTLSNLSTGCANIPNYTDYSATLGTTVALNQTYSITVAPGPQWGQYFVLLIDFNGDQDFADPGEFFDLGYAAGGATLTTNVTMPGIAAATSTRMRVMCRYGTGTLTQADVCATGLSFGEVEDYFLNILPPPPNDAAHLAFTSPTLGCALTATENVTIQVGNYGTDSITSFTACYTLNGGSPVCEVVNQTIQPGDTFLYTFTATANLGTPGSYTLDGWVNLVGDNIAFNDSTLNHLVENIPLFTSLPYSEDFDSNNGGWTAEGNLSTWEHGAPSNIFIDAAASPDSAWVTSLTGLYNDDELSYLISPCFDFGSLTADPFVKFSHIFNTESCCDEGWLEVSTNGGATWNKVGSAATGNNWYNDATNEWWDGDSGPFGQWRSADHRLDSTAGSSSVRLRFVISTDGSVQYEGFGVDNFQLLDSIFNAGVVSIQSPLNGCSLTATETVSVEITNAGTHDITGFDVCFTVDAGPPVCETVTATIGPGATYVYTFTATADLSTPGAHTIGTATVLPNDGTPENDTLSIAVTNFPVINTFPYIEDFENGSGDWISNGTNNDWELGTPFKATIIGAASGQNAWVTGTTGAFNYQPNADSWVESPCFDLTGNSGLWVASRAWWESEFSWDGVVLEFSTDGGNVWSELGAYGDPFNWYTDTTINGLVAAGNSGHGWAGRTDTQNGSNGYLQTSHDLDTLNGLANVRFRMHFGSDASVQDDGFAFDDFAIAPLPTVSLGNDTLVCEQLTLAPALDTNGTFFWSTFDSTSTLDVTTSGQYVLTYTSIFGLVGRDTINVIINPTPEVDLGPDQNVCVGDTLCITVDPAAYPTVSWSTGGNTNTECISTTGMWYVDVVDSVGCVSADTFNTAIVQLPTVNIGPDQVNCFGDTICLSAGNDPNLTYLWSNGQTTADICTSIISGYWAQVTDSNGCSARDSMFVTQGPMAPTNATASFDTTACPLVVFGDSTAGVVDTWFWDFGDGNTSTSQHPSNDYATAGNGTYTVTLVAGNDCGQDTTSFTVDINCLVAIDGAANTSLRVFPNPNQGEFRIETLLSGTAPVSIEIVDLRGQQVYRKDYGEASGMMVEDIRLTQAAGVYFVRLKVGDQLFTEKVVIE